VEHQRETAKEKAFIH